MRTSPRPKPARRIAHACAAFALFTGLAACGEKSTTTRPTEDGAKPAFVISLIDEGGFTTPRYQFVRTPRLLVLPDGTAYITGAQLAIFPGPFMPAVMQGTIPTSEISRLLDEAKKANLLRQVTYQPNNLVADAPTTVLRLMVDGVEYRHAADALGLGGDSADTDRAALAGFVALLDAVQPTDGKPAVVDQVAIRAMPPLDVAPPEFDTPPVAWPADIGVALADATDCKLISAAAAGKVFATANELTTFTEAGTTYAVFGRPHLPGDTC